MTIAVVWVQVPSSAWKELQQKLGLFSCGRAQVSPRLGRAYRVPLARRPHLPMKRAAKGLQGPWTQVQGLASGSVGAYRVPLARSAPSSVWKEPQRKLRLFSMRKISMSGQSRAHTDAHRYIPGSGFPYSRQSRGCSPEAYRKVHFRRRPYRSLQ